MLQPGPSNLTTTVTRLDAAGGMMSPSGSGSLTPHAQTTAAPPPVEAPASTNPRRKDGSPPSGPERSRRPQRNADGDTVELSKAGRDRAQHDPASTGRPTAEPPTAEPGARSADGDPLTDDERRALERLERRDAKVRAHEQAHVAAAGELYRGGPYYTYESGPDGRRYAVGGSVSIDTAPVENDPAATILKAMKIRRAALAPADPSSADRAVAAKASRLAAEAERELAERQAAERRRSARRSDGPPPPRDSAHANSTPTAQAGSAPADRAPAPQTPTQDPDRPSSRAVSMRRLGDLIPTSLARSMGESAFGTLRTNHRETLWTRPTDDLLTRPTDDLLTPPTDVLMSPPTETLWTRPADDLMTPPVPISQLHTRPSDDLMTDTERQTLLGRLYG